MQCEYYISRLYYPTRNAVAFIGVALACAVTPSGAFANLQDLPRVCAGIEVRSLNISEEMEREVLLDPVPEKPAINMVRISPLSPSLDVAEKIIWVTAIGPAIEKYSTSHTVETDLACTSTGVRLTATILQYSPIIISNKSVLWRPKIEMEVVLRQPEVSFETTWRMRLPTGVELEHAQTPPYPDQNYPITVSKTLSSYTP